MTTFHNLLPSPICMYVCMYVWQINGKEKKPQKPHPKFKKYKYQIFTENICSACNPVQVIIFCKYVLSL